MITKNVWPVIALALLIVILLITNCTSCQKIGRLKKDCEQKLLKSDTVTVRDTVYRTDTIRSVPTLVTTKPYKPTVRTVHDTVIQVQSLAEEIKLCWSYYLDTSIYNDLQAVNGGTIQIYDTVTRNKITGRRITANIPKETITHTVTNTIETKKQNAVFAGLNAMGEKEDLGLGPQVLFVHKNGFAINAAAMYTTRERMQYNAGAVFKIGKK
jgi:hypothetical protein